MKLARMKNIFLRLPRLSSRAYDLLFYTVRYACFIRDPLLNMTRTKAYHVHLCVIRVLTTVGMAVEGRRFLNNLLKSTARPKTTILVHPLLFLRLKTSQGPRMDAKLFGASAFNQSIDTCAVDNVIIMLFFVCSCIIP